MIIIPNDIKCISLHILHLAAHHALSRSLSLSLLPLLSPHLSACCSLSPNSRNRKCFSVLMVLLAYLMLIQSGISNWQIVYSLLYSLATCHCNLFKTTFFFWIASHNSLHLSVSFSLFQSQTVASNKNSILSFGLLVLMISIHTLFFLYLLQSNDLFS